MVKLNILYVSNDNVCLLDSISYALQDKFDDFTVEFIQVHSLQSAKEVLEHKYISCLVLDIDLVQTQFEYFLSFLNNNPKLDSLVTIVLAHDDKFKTISYENGIDDFFVKPINTDELISKLSKILKEKQLHQEVANKLFSQKKDIKKIKNDMLVLFTHELKTPLNAIINFSSYINRHLQKELTPKK